MKTTNSLYQSCRTEFRGVRLTSYILNRPELTFLQVATPVAIEYSCEECSWNGPRLTWWILMINRQYKFVGGNGGCSIPDTGTSLWSTKFGTSARQLSLCTEADLEVAHSQRCTQESASHRVPTRRGYLQVLDDRHPVNASRDADIEQRQSRQYPLLLLN